IASVDLREKVKNLFRNHCFLTDARILFTELTVSDLFNLLRLREANGKLIFNYLFREPDLCKIILQRLSSLQLAELCQLHDENGRTLLHLVFSYNDWCS